MFSGVIASFGSGSIGAVDCGGTRQTEPDLGKVPTVYGGHEGLAPAFGGRTWDFEYEPDAERELDSRAVGLGFGSSARSSTFKSLVGLEGRLLGDNGEPCCD